MNLIEGFFLIKNSKHLLLKCIFSFYLFTELLIEYLWMLDSWDKTDYLKITWGAGESVFFTVFLYVID